MTRFYALLTAFICVLMLTALPAEAAGKRKVTKFEYDGLGRQVKAQVFDDVGVDAALVSQSETEYDKYNNTIIERQIATPYDRSRVYTYQSYLAYHSGDQRYMVEQRYEYGDTTWPTKLTKSYSPRAATWDQAYQDKWARHYYYDGATGQLELEFGSAQYCLELGSETVETFTVDRSGATESINIRDFDRCSAQAFTYDALGRVLTSKTSQALGYHDIAHLADRAWVETEMSYYGETSAQHGAPHTSKVIGTDEASSRTATFNWDAAGNLISVKNNAGHETVAGYDVMRRIVSAQDPLGGTTQYAYDPAGRLRAISKKIDAGEWAVSHATYFANGQIQTVSDPDGDATQYSYDAAGRLDITTDAEGRQTKVKYLPNGQTHCVIKAFGTPLQQAYAAYEYGPDGQAVSQRPAKGSDSQTCAKLTDDYDTTFLYDEYRTLFETVFPSRPEDFGASYARNGHSYSREWRDRGGVIYQTRTRGGDLIKQYTDHNGHNYIRLTKEADYRFANYGGTGAQHWATISPKKTTASVSSLAFADYDTTKRRYVQMPYGARGELLMENTRDGYGQTGDVNHLSPQIHSSQYFYDPADNVARYYDFVYDYDASSYVTRAQSRYDYDERGAMTAAFFSPTSFSANESPVAQFSYDTLGRMTSQTFGDGSKTKADGTPAYARQSYMFDADSDLREKKHEWAASGQSTLSGFSHLFDQDASGKIIKAFASSADWQFSPNPHSEDYGDANALDQYSSVDLGDGEMCADGQEDGCTSNGAQSFTYDGSGNLTSDGAGRTYTYNSENQMIRATGTGLDMEYRYDALGRRSHSIDHIGDTERFHKHIGQMEVGDYAVTREGGALGVGRVMNYALLTRNVIGAGVDQRLAFYELSNGDELTFPMTNHQGSTIALVTDEGERKADADGGRFVYGPYGQEVSGATDAGYPYRYTGRRLDVQTGLYYYRARYYDAKTGRFLQTDPIGTADQMNLYGYVGNDPANGTDPSGMVIECENGSCIGDSGDVLVTTNGINEGVRRGEVESEINKMSRSGDLESKLQTIRDKYNMPLEFDDAHVDSSWWPPKGRGDPGPITIGEEDREPNSQIRIDFKAATTLIAGLSNPEEARSAQAELDSSYAGRQWFTFKKLYFQPYSLDRIIYHEVDHAWKGATNTAARYGGGTEGPVVARTNAYLWNYNRSLPREVP